MSRQQFCAYLIGTLVAGLGIAWAHYIFHYYD